MNNQPIRLTDELVARVVRARSADAGPHLLDDIVSRVTMTPQDRPWWYAGGPLLPRRTLLIVALLALLVAAAGAIAIGARLFRPEPVQLVRPNAEIVALDVGGLVAFDPVTGQRQETIRCSGCSFLSWSGDGSKLAYLQAGVVILQHVASGATMEVAKCSQCSGISLAFDATRIAYVDHSIAFVRDVSGGPARQLSERQDVEDIAWSPLGDELLIMGRGSLYRVGEDGSGPELLVGGSVQPIVPSSGPIYATWASEGDRIAYVIDAANTDAGVPFEYQLWVMRADGSDRRRIHTVPDCCIRAWGGPTWSPDGAQIAFVAGHSGAYTLFIVEADGSSPRQIGEVLPERVAWRSNPEP